MMQTNKGFTMIELLVALLIFALGIVGAAKLQMAAMNANTYSLQISQALNIAQDRIESLKVLPLSNTAFTVQDGTATTQTVHTSQGIDFFSTYSVTTLGVGSSTTGNASARNVTVTVTWLDKGNSAHSTSLSFIKGQNQP